MPEVAAPKYVPFDQVAEFTDRVSVDELQLPAWFERDQFGVNLQRVEQIGFWGGLGHIALSTYDGEKTSYSVDVSGVDAIGTAVAGRKATVQRAELSKHTIDASGACVPWVYRRPDVTVAINNAAIDELLQEKRASLRDLKARARLSDKAVRESLRDCVRKNIIHRESVTSSTAAYGIWSAVTLLGLGINTVGEYSGRMLVTGLGVNFIEALIANKMPDLGSESADGHLFMGYSLTDWPSPTGWPGLQNS